MKKGEDMFNVGDIVEIEDQSGMLDFVKGRGYEVMSISCHHLHNLLVKIKDESGVEDWFHHSHFKLKENTGVGTVSEFGVGDIVVCTETDFYELDVNDITRLKEYIVKRSNRGCVQIVKDSGELGWFSSDKFKPKEDTLVEKKECLFKKGQVVWDVVYGKGVVSCVEEDDFFPVKVELDAGGSESYTLQGSFYEGGTRTLFFSEPKIEAATEPVFEPVLKKGDVVFGIHASGHVDKFDILQEYEDEIHSQSGEILGKRSWAFYRLGEKINFK